MTGKKTNPCRPGQEQQLWLFIVQFEDANRFCSNPLQNYRTVLRMVMLQFAELNWLGLAQL